MSAGYIQLAAIGQQDAYLTGAPDVTYFSSVYRRHTPFLLESYEIPFIGSRVNYGQNNICRLPPKGDLIRGLTLKMILPSLLPYGNDWYWTKKPSSLYVPTLIIDGVTYTGPVAGFQYYSSNSLSTSIWLNPGGSTYFTNKVTYNSSTNKFVINATTSVAVIDSPEANGGVFWGLDPKNYSSIVAGKLVYNAVNGQVVPDFTLEQAGWARTQGLIVDPLEGIFVKAIRPYTIGTGQQFLDFKKAVFAGPVWSNQDSTQAYSITSGGRINFRNTGIYIIRAAFTTGSGTFQNIAFGSDTSDGPVYTTPVYFEQTYSPPLNTDPSLPITFPLMVSSSSNNYYFYVTTTSGIIAANTYISINPSDDFYKFKNDVTPASNNSARIPFYNNIDNIGAVGTTLNSDSSFTFNVKGQWMVSAVLNVNPSQNPYISNVFLGESANNIYSYDMSSQQRNPTSVIHMPIVVTDTAAKYHMNVSSINSATAQTLNSSSFVSFSYLGIPKTNPSSGGTVLPYNGILYQPTSNLITTPFNFNSNFTSNGFPYIISTTSTGGIQVSNVGTYMLTTTLQTADMISSLAVSNTQYGITETYPIGIGIQPPYCINLPFRANIAPLTFSVSVSSVGFATSPNIYSNSFVWVYPVASNVVLPDSSYTYADSVGTYAIRSADLKIGGQTVQTLTGEYIECWNDLNVPYENQPGLKLLTGKGDTTQVRTAPPGRTYYINLPYYFYNNPELYLPIVSADRQDVEVHVNFRTFSELTAVSNLVPLVNQVLQASIIVEYVYLSDPEINWFKNTQLEYVITQCQYQNIDLTSGFTQGVFQLLFKNPVKELWFIIQPVGQSAYDYTYNGLSTLGVSFNGEDFITARITDPTQLSVIEPFTKYPTFPSRTFFMKSFSTRPTSSKPFGHINFSRLRQVLLSLNMYREDGYYPTKQVRVIAVNYNVLKFENGIAGLMYIT